MQKLKVGLIGLGTVGRSLLHVLRKEQTFLQVRTGLDIEIVRVCDRSWQNKKALLEDIPASSSPDTILEDDSIDIVVELVGGLEPAHIWLRTALERGKSVVTANKALLASRHGEELLSLAYKKQVELCFEAAVGGAIPLIQNFRRGLVSARVEALYGILNGTSNFILTQMEDKGMDYLEALQKAQQLGYAEANPDFDVGGQDAAQKLAILAALALDIPILIDRIKIEGITNIEPIDLEFAASLGYRVRPLAIARQSKTNGGLQLSVHPGMIPKKHLLASVDSAMNALLLESNYTGKMIFIGPGAGGLPTASSVISDLVFIGQKKETQPERWLVASQKNPPRADFLCRFYLRFRAKDRPGVLAEITRVLADHDISIATLHQYARKEPVDIVVLTHEISEEKMDATLKKMNYISSMHAPVVAIRIEEGI